MQVGTLSRSLALVLLCVVLGFPTEVAGFTNQRAKVAVHITPYSEAAGCGSITPPACNVGDSTLTVSAPPGYDYDLYIFVMDGRDSLNLGSGLTTVGVKGVQFGIAYNNAPESGVDILSFAACVDGLVQNSSTWPDSGSGTVLTWNTCQSTRTSGDLDHGISTVAYFLRIHVYSEDVFRITVHPNSGKLSVSDCFPRETDLLAARAAGSAAFTGHLSDAYDPCTPLSPLTEFSSATQSELDSLAAKVTYVGYADYLRENPVLIGPTGGRVPLLDDFDRFRLLDNYFEGPSPPIVFGSTAELAALIDSATALGLTPTVADSAAQLSFSLVLTENGVTKGFEAVLDSAMATLLFADMLQVFAGDSAAASVLHDFGCGTGLLPDTPPTDVSSSVSVVIGGFRFDRKNFVYVTQARVENTGSSTLEAPLILAVDVELPVLLANAAGESCRLPNGRWVVKLPGGDLAPSASVDVVLQFRSTGKEPIRVSTWVYSGPGVW